MMTGIESENLAREWKDDPYARELWDSLGQIETDPPTGFANLQRLAEAGSALAMMHLGHILLSGAFGVEKDVVAGEAWLWRSAECGSIEGAYRLANFLLAGGQVEEAMSLFNGLSERGYSPASFILGLELYRGHYVPTDVSKAIKYLQQAASMGHIHAKHWLSFILMKRSRGTFDRLKGLCIRV